MTPISRSVQPAAGSAKPWYRRPWIWILAIVFVAGVAIGGPIAYARWLAPKAPAPLAAVTAAPSATMGGMMSAAPLPSSDISPDGTWHVAPGSLAGYRVNEVLNGQSVTVVGRTEKVQGSVTVTDSRITAATITVDMASVTTDSGSRDSQFRNAIVHTDQYPTAEFVATEPQRLDPADPHVMLPGTLSIAGKSQAVTAHIIVSLDDAGRITAAGEIPIRFADWGIAAPNLGFVKVEDHGVVEYSIALAK